MNTYSNQSFPLRHALLLLSMRASVMSVCPSYRPTIDCTNSELKLWTFASCSFLQSVVTFSRLGQYVSQYLACKALSLRYNLNVKDEVSQLTLKCDILEITRFYKNKVH